MPRPRRPVVIQKSRLNANVSKSGGTGVYVITGAVAVGALVYLLREKGRSAPVGELSWGGGFTSSVSNAFHSATNAVQNAAQQAADAAKQAASQAANAAKVADIAARLRSGVSVADEAARKLRATADAARIASDARAYAERAAREAQEAATSALKAGAKIASPAAVVAFHKNAVSQSVDALKTVRGQASDVVQGARNTVVGTLIVGAMKIGIIKVDNPDGTSYPAYTDGTGNALSRAQYIDSIVKNFRIAGDAAATAEMLKGGVPAADIDEGRAKWVSLGSPRDSQGPDPSNSGGGVDPSVAQQNAAARVEYIDSMVPWFKARGDTAATAALATQGIPPADVNEARAKWVAMGSPRDPQRSDDTGSGVGPGSGSGPGGSGSGDGGGGSTWKNPYSTLAPPAGGGSGGSSGGGSSGGSSGGSGGGSGGSGGGSPEDVARARDAQLGPNGAPKGKTNPLLVVGGVVAAPFLMHFLGGK